MLQIDNLVVEYAQRRAVNGLSLALDAAEIVTLVGPTGCGKSSLLRAIAGFEDFAAGQIRIADQVITRNADVPAEQRQAGLVFQDFALFPHMSVRDNVRFRVTDVALADTWLDKLGLSEHRDAMPGTLSGGQKQRVALARTLAHQPRLVLLDEPLSSLDASLKSGLQWQIRTALKEAGTPALWVTHDQEEALTVGDRIGVMDQGRLVQIGEPEQCYRTPATRFVATFLGDGVFLRGSMGQRGVDTELGPLALDHLVLQSQLDDPQQVDVLIRPHDVSLSIADAGDASILWGRYEGETRLYGVRLRDGSCVHVRTAHDQILCVGQRVTAAVSAHHRLPVFPVTATGLEPGMREPQR